MMIFSTAVRRFIVIICIILYMYKEKGLHGVMTVNL